MYGSLGRNVLRVPGNDHIKAVAHFVTQSPGGRGAVRELIDMILDSHEAA